MKANLWMVGGMAIAVIGSLFLPSSLVRADLEPDCAVDPYGIDGKLSEEDLRALFYIAFPQTTGDMRGRFGSPACFDAVADYYLVEGTNHWVAVDYSDDSAVGWRAWEVYQ